MSEQRWDDDSLVTLLLPPVTRYCWSLDRWQQVCSSITSSPLCVCVCVSMTVEVGSQTQVLFCRNNLLNFWERVFYWYLRNIDEARLAGQTTQGFYLSLPTQCWDYKQMPSWSPPAEITSKRHHTLLFIYFLFFYWH